MSFLVARVALSFKMV